MFLSLKLSNVVFDFVYSFTVYQRRFLCASSCAAVLMTPNLGMQVRVPPEA